MLLGARQFFEKRGGGWQNPYVTDGLVAMWDCEWNAGGGVHSSDRILTNLVTGETVSIPTIGYEVGDNYIISDANKRFELGDLTDRVDTPCTLCTLGCCMTRPTNVGYTAGVCEIYGIGSVFMWRYRNDVAGIVGGYVFQSDGKVHYYGAPASLSTALVEANAETFGALRSRAAVMPTQGSASGLTYYCDGSAKSGTNTMSYTEPWYAGNKLVRSPVSDSAQVKWCNISVYSRALTAAEIAANYAVDKARFKLP